MIDFIYVKFITSTSNFIKRKVKNIRMTKKRNIKEILPESNLVLKLIEYYDFFINTKNKKISAKNFGEKTALLNSYFFEFLKGYNIPIAFEKKVDTKSLQFLKYTEFTFRVKILNSADDRN